MFRSLERQPATDGHAILDRLQQISRLADLDPGRRLDSKVDFTPSAVHNRLLRQSMLRTACCRLHVLAKDAG